MKVKKIRTIGGPNVYHEKPVLVMTLDLEDRAEVASDELPGFTDRLVECVPGLREHRCSPGYAGGFLERLGRGTYFAHIVEHVALELSTPAGIEVGFGKSIYGGSPGIYQVVVRYRAENAMRYLLYAAVDLVEACASGARFDPAPVVERARRIADEEKLGPSTQAIVDAAERRGIPWRRRGAGSWIEFGYGRHTKRIRATLTGATSSLAVELAQDKERTKAALARAGVPVPCGIVAGSAEGAVRAFRELECAVAVKPRDGNHGNGVGLGLDSDAAVRAAFEVAREFSPEVIVEEFYRGRDYRALVVGGKLVAMAERTPAHVVGDGAHTLAELVEIENQNPFRGQGHKKPLTRIVIDRSARAYLGGSGVALDSVPDPGQVVYLSPTANLSKGGTAVDVTDQAHPDIVRVCERAARTIGLDVAGIDLVIEDLSRPIADQRGGVIEVNAAPGIRMHHYPARGQARDAGGAILEHLYPEGETGRIPIVSVTGTNGKTTVTRMIGHLLHEDGQRVGITTTHGIYLGETEIVSGDTTGPSSARIVLEDPWVEVAVLETARGGILRRGLGYDWSDVGVITNVQADHIGQDGIENVDDVLRIKSLVAERVKPGGTLVLNAEDPRVAGLVNSRAVRAAEKHVIFYATDPSHPVIERHLEAGGTAYFVRGGKAVEASRGRETILGDLRELPVTVFGTADFQVSNCLAAVAAGRAVGLSIELVWRGLRSFEPHARNAGRGNFYRVNGGLLLVDYGHNPEALRAVGRTVRRWNVRRAIGVVAAPGDRSDEMIRLCGEAAAESFDRLVLREDVDLRGRASGEVPGLLARAIRGARANVPCEIHVQETEALRAAVRDLGPGDVAVFFYEDYERIRRHLAAIGAQPVTDPRELGLLASGARLPTDPELPLHVGLYLKPASEGNFSEVS